ncbi:TPA: helix-turn-helix domain-containing protein [Stenotrophomonas maltophilia]|nr:helix-turn-helix domain-containing protein [Stenotrophomonas maltophilia]HEL5042736.1 helix-turn-helix domain-containing protein [Stenotrophomonas maltophilia]
MKISEAADASGCHLETIRYYERIGLLPRPSRSGNGYRVYGSADVERLRFIARGRDLGFSLEEVRSLLQLADDEDLSCADVDRLARSHLADVRARVADLQRMASELERVIASCHGGQRAECTILSTLRQPASQDAARR